jgi:hypothetical protein
MSDDVNTQVVSEGGAWKLIIGDPAKTTAHLVSEVISNQVKPEIQTRVNIDKIEREVEKEVTNDKGKTKKVKDKVVDIVTSVSEVYYPKHRYSRQAVESAAAEIAQKQIETDCPLCQKMKVAISVPEKPSILDEMGLPKLEDVFPDLEGMFNPVGDAFVDMSDAINDILSMPFGKPKK